jgi:hypothetical protein
LVAFWADKKVTKWRKSNRIQFQELKASKAAKAAKAVQTCAKQPPIRITTKNPSAFPHQKTPLHPSLLKYLADHEKG